MVWSLTEFFFFLELIDVTLVDEFEVVDVVDVVADGQLLRYVVPLTMFLLFCFHFYQSQDNNGIKNKQAIKCYITLYLIRIIQRRKRVQEKS